MEGGARARGAGLGRRGRKGAEGRSVRRRGGEEEKREKGWDGEGMARGWRAAEGMASLPLHPRRELPTTLILGTGGREARRLGLRLLLKSSTSYLPVTPRSLFRKSLGKLRTFLSSWGFSSRTSPSRRTCFASRGIRILNPGPWHTVSCGPTGIRV